MKEIKQAILSNKWNYTYLEAKINCLVHLHTFGGTKPKQLYKTFKIYFKGNL